MTSPTFSSLPVHPSRTVSWIHIGDTHLTRPGEQNELDLGRIVDEINDVYAHGGVDFVFLPGDIADDGSARAYRAMRRHLDRLQLPWCAIVGDHDVHERSFRNFEEYAGPELHGAFTVGAYRFLRLNAFSQPKPDSFTVSTEQLEWLEGELQACQVQHRQAVALLHCYPSDLKQGGARLSELLRQYPVLMVDMGHTHYNELSNDGAVIYGATRSTGQIEEGPVGYSLITLDESVVSWHFVRLGEPALVAITFPADRRLLTTRTSPCSPSFEIQVRAKAWSRHPITAVTAELEKNSMELTSADGLHWAGEIDSPRATHREHRLVVTAQDVSDAQFASAIQLSHESVTSLHYATVDQDNAIGAWTERDILGTQLGPNKNGRKW